jgi:hypothetical protein
LFAQQAAELDGLISSIPKASFGKGGETVYDTNIRDALQLKAENFVLSLPQEKIDEVLVSIKEEMELTTDIIAEPYSLNGYQKGGKFLKHKDTPRGDDMFGTLVLCLPSWFTGGTMEVSLGDEKLTTKYTQLRRVFESLWRIYCLGRIVLQQNQSYLVL